MGHELTNAVAAASFWLFIAIAVVAGVSSAAFRHRETQKTIRQAIENGQTLDPVTLERLLRSNHPPPPSRKGVIAGGIMLLAVAGGLALIGWATAADQLGEGVVIAGGGQGGNARLGHSSERGRGHPRPFPSGPLINRLTTRRPTPSKPISPLTARPG